MQIKMALGFLIGCSPYRSHQPPSSRSTESSEMSRRSTVCRLPPRRSGTCLRWRPPLPPRAYAGGHLQASNFPPCFQKGRPPRLPRTERIVCI